jgi:hypothetical protein
MALNGLDANQVLQSVYDSSNDTLKVSVSDGSAGGTLTDKSGTTSGTPNTSTTLAAANSSRKYFFVQNMESSGDIFINFTSAAANTTGGASIKLVPGAAFCMEGSFVSTELITVTGSAASLKFTAKEA